MMALMSSMFQYLVIIDIANVLAGLCDITRRCDFLICCHNLQKTLANNAIAIAKASI